MKKNIGFIGCGKMASAIISGILTSEKDEHYNVTGSEINDEVAKSASDRLGIKVLTDNKELVKNSDIVFIATKPNCVVDVLNAIKSELSTDKLLVSIAAGVSTEKIEKLQIIQELLELCLTLRLLLNLECLVFAKVLKQLMKI